MANWFIIKIKYHKETEGGKIEKVLEEYLFDALTYGEVEQRVMKELAENIRFEFNLVNIAKTNLHDIFHFDEGENWFKCKISFLELDEAKGKEKTVNQYVLIFAYSVEDAYQKLREALMESGLKIFEITAIHQTKIVDVFEYHMAEPAFIVQKKKENPDFEEELEPESVFSTAFSTELTDNPLDLAQKNEENTYFD